VPLVVRTYRTDELDQLLELGGKQVAKLVLSQVATMARSKWVQIAQHGLNSTRGDYIAGIQPVRNKGTLAYIELLGRMANLVEQGMEPFDLHDTLLGDSAGFWMESKDGGRYRSIPFRHTIPGSGRGAGLPMGEAFMDSSEGSRAAPHTVLANAEALGKQIYAAAKRLKPGEALEAGLAPLLRGHHATDIYAGMVRSGAAKNKHYMTFRTISTGPSGEGRPPGKWLHPGITARNFVSDVAEFVDDQTPKVISGILQGVLGK